MMLVAVFLILMGSLIDVLAVESQNSIESADSSAAINAAYSGVDLMILSIEEFYDNSIQNGQPPQTVECGFQRPGGGTVTTYCTAKIVQTWNGDGINYYLIDSTGNAIPSQDQEVDREVRALVREVPFGAYAHFSESENSNTGGAIWYSQHQHFNGPVYSGGKMHIMYDSADFGSPIFPMGFTSDQSMGAFQWIDVQDGGGNSPPNTPDEKAAVWGSSNPTFVPSAIQLPGFAQNLVLFSEAYYGDSAHDNSQDLQNAAQASGPGVFVNGGDPNCPSGTLCTGIFVVGNVDVQGASVKDPNGGLATGSQTWTITSQDGSFPQYTVTVNFGANTTTVKGPNGTTTYNGVASGEPSDTSLGNGAIFVDGSVNVADNSTAHGQYTLAVPDPPIKGESITLGGSFTDASDPQFGASQDEIALWADTVLLNSQDPSVTVEAEVLTGYANECTTRGCGGWFGNVFCKATGCSGSGTGSLTLYGSDIENLHGKMGVVDSNGDPIAGYLRTQQYDARLGAVPPPFSPTTNLYSIVALQDVGWGVNRPTSGF